MIKKAYLSIALLLVVCCSSASTTELPDNSSWQLVWSDEFDYQGAPDNSKWTFATDGNAWEWGNNEDQFYTNRTKNAFVEDGLLHICAFKEDWTEPVSGVDKLKKYTSARLVTKDKAEWKYAKVAVRAKLPMGLGTWPAIWMLPSKSPYGGWPICGEIDIMENVGYDPDTILATLHTERYNHKTGEGIGSKLNISNSDTDFHDYVLEWQEDEIKIFVDDQLYFTYHKPQDADYKVWPFDQEFHLLLNLAIGGGWAGAQGIDDSLFPHTFLIDYVRVYQKQ